MSNQNSKQITKSFLDSLYKNVKMGADSIIDLLPKVKDNAMREELTAELEQYEKFAKDIRQTLFDIGEEPKEESFMAKAMTKMGISFNPMMDTTVSHIADIMIQGATMGVTETMRLLRESENGCVSESALRLLRDVCAFEEKVVEDMKSYLR